MNSLLFWLLMLFAFYVMYALGARTRARRAAGIVPQPPPIIPSDKLAACEAKLAPLIVITAHRVLGEILEFDGRLRGSAVEVFRKIRETFAGEAVTPMLLQGEESEVRVLLVPEADAKSETLERPNWMLHWLLFFATLATTT